MWKKSQKLFQATLNIMVEAAVYETILGEENLMGICELFQDIACALFSKPDSFRYIGKKGTIGF